MNIYDKKAERYLVLRIPEAAKEDLLKKLHGQGLGYAEYMRGLLKTEFGIAWRDNRIVTKKRNDIQKLQKEQVHKEPPSFPTHIPVPIDTKGIDNHLYRS